MLSVKAAKTFTKGEEVAMTYNNIMLDSYILLEHYGFLVDNNMFATLGLTISNI
jgi:hypothetical protein